MADIVHQLMINAPKADVFAVVATADGLEKWWSEASTGEEQVGAEWTLRFGPEYDWRAVVDQRESDHFFELKMGRSDDDWEGTCVSFQLIESADRTTVRFRHDGWRELNEHFVISNYCWAMYLRLLRRYIELGEVVPYSLRAKA